MRNFSITEAQSPGEIRWRNKSMRNSFTSPNQYQLFTKISNPRYLYKLNGLTMHTFVKYITIDDSIDDNEAHPPEDRRLSLAYEQLTEIPFNLAERFGWWVQILDLSNNEISDVTFLSCFDRLNTVILDRNKINSTAIFPPLPSIRTLWINNNHISNLILFLTNLAQSCPNLENFSMMGNVGAPSFINGATPRQNHHYRVYVASLFLKLQHLDDRKVSFREREDAYRLKGMIANKDMLSKLKPPTLQTLYPTRHNNIV